MALSWLFGGSSPSVANAQKAQVDQSETVRLARMKEYWQAYDNQLPLPLKQTKSDPQGRDNVRLNYSALVVDIGVAYLFGKEIDFACDGTPENEDEAWLDLAWAQNGLMPTLLELAINGGVTGHSFVRLMPPDPDMDHKYPEVVVLDPQNVSIVTAPDNYKKIVAYALSWNAVDPLTGNMLVYRQDITRQDKRWHILEQVSRGDSKSWQVTQDVDWPFSWSPIHGCQNLPLPNSVYGRSDLEDVVPVNNSVNFSVSNSRRIERIHGHPKTVVTGMGKASLDVAVDEVLFLPNPTAQIRNLEMQSDLTAAALWYDKIKSALHEITRIPECATGKVDNLGALSGVALQTLFGPLLQKTFVKQVLYGPMVERLNEHMLEMGGRGVHTVQIIWPDVLPKNEQEEAQTCLLDEQLGASKRTLLTKRGYDPDREMEQSAEEDSNATTLGSNILDAFEKGKLPGQGAKGKGGKGGKGGNATDPPSMDDDDDTDPGEDS